jgi:hypothetical protein
MTAGFAHCTSELLDGLMTTDEEARRSAVMTQSGVAPARRSFLNILFAMHARRAAASSSRLLLTTRYRSVGLTDRSMKSFDGHGPTGSRYARRATAATNSAPTGQCDCAPAHHEGPG